MPTFTYEVKATVWASTGSGKPWQGEVTIEIRADSSVGLQTLRGAVRTKAQSWLRDQGLVPSGQLDLNEWAPKRRR